MVYHSQTMRLSEVSLIRKGELGNIMVCEDLASPERKKYSVFSTSDHELIAKLHRVYRIADNLTEEGSLTYFSDGGKFFIVYPFIPAREVSRFYMGRNMPMDDCENVVKNYCLTCMTCGLPWPVLSLAISQDQVNMARDGSVYMSYAIDLSALDEKITEADCVKQCADVLLSMLNQKPENVAWDMRALLMRKNERGSHKTFIGLYRDVDAASKHPAKKTIFQRLLMWFDDHKDRLFRILLVISIILLIFTLVTFLTNAIFGDVPWLRLFIRSFERIGEESLVQ